MTYKEKYEDLDRSQLPEKAIVIIDTMKKDSKGFTDTEALEVIGPKFDQVIAKLKSSGYDAAFKSLQKKEPEPKTPVAKAKKIVQQAIKQPKTTAKTAKPTVGAFKKGAVGELAKKIRKEGEAWPTALKRAGQMIKEQKSGVQKKANAQYKKLNSLLTKMPALRKGTDVERDAPRKAKPIGKRTAKSGSTYYEYRSNRTDVRQGKGYPYLKLGAMLAKGGEISKMYDEITMFDEISEKQISYIIKKMNEAKGPKNFDKELQKLVNWVWDNEPLLSKDQNVKGIKFLKNLAFMANGKSRSNSPFGSREEYTVKNFAYMKLRGFHDVSLYGQVEQYVPLYTVFDDEGYGFEYYYHAGKVNVVGAKGMTTKKGSVEVNFFDTDKKVKDFLNLSRVQFMARYKVTKDNYQKMVSAITRNIEGVFSHGGKMAGAGMFSEGGKMNKYDVVYNSYDQETGDMIADHESVYVMASSTSEAKNKAMTMLEEGSRDEDFTIVRVNGMMADGGMTKDFSGNYYSTNDFVGSNGLKDLANKVFGMGWEAEDDVDQIAELANHAGLKYVIINAQNRSEWNNYRQIDTAHPTNDSNYDIFVIANQDWKKYVNDSEGDSDYDDGEYAKGGHMAKGGRINKVYEVAIDLGEMGTQTIAHFDNIELAEAFLDGYRLADSTSNVFIDTVTSDFLETMNSKGSHMAKGGLTNMKGTAPVSKYPEIKPEITIVE